MVRDYVHRLHVHFLLMMKELNIVLKRERERGMVNNQEFIFEKLLLLLFPHLPYQLIIAKILTLSVTRFILLGKRLLLLLQHSKSKKLINSKARKWINMKARRATSLMVMMTDGKHLPILTHLQFGAPKRSFQHLPHSLDPHSQANQ